MNNTVKRRMKIKNHTSFLLARQTRQQAEQIYIHENRGDMTIYDMELRRVLMTHDITWSRKDSFCKGQFADNQPEELPSAPVTVSISQKRENLPKSAFAKFAFGGDRNE